MKIKGSSIAYFTIVMAMVFSVYHFSVRSTGWIFSTLLLSIITISVFWLGKKYDEKVNTHEQLIQNKEKIESDLQQQKEKVSEYELLFNSLTGVIFINDLLKTETQFSKGVEQLFSCTANYLEQSGDRWKDLIHPSDRHLEEESEKQLLLGHTTEIEFRILNPQEEEKWILKRATPIQNDNKDTIKIIGQFIDITKRKHMENELKYMAYFDELTDLPNRKSLDRHIEKALSRSKRHHYNFTLMFIDLDDFKVVNDTLGHDAGDLLLKEAVNRINQSIRDEDLVARLGGDEFIVVFEDTSKDEIEHIAERILEAASLPYDIEGNDAKISLSIGMSMYPDDGEDKKTLIEHADQAMYYAKNNGKNSYKLYTPDLVGVELKKTGLFERWMNTIQNTIFKG